MKRGRKVLLGGLLVFVFLTSASQSLLKLTSGPTPHPPRASDIYDPNESFSTARYITSGWTHKLNVSKTDIYDWFYVYVSANYRLTVKLNWSISRDLDLYILNGYQTELDSSHDDRTHHNETVTYDVRTAGNYYIKVYYWDWNYTGNGGLVNYSMYVSNNVPVSTVDPEDIVLIVIPLVAVLGIICAAGVVVNKNKKKLQTRSPNMFPVRSQVQTSLPTTSAPPKPRLYEQQPPPIPQSYEPPIPPKPLVNVETPKPRSKIRFCVACGAQLEPAQRFCHNCGMDMEASR